MRKKNRILFSAILGVILLVVIFVPKPWETSEPLDEVEVVDSTQVREIVYKYGIPMDDYEVDFGVVKRNQNLSSILELHGVGRQRVHDLTQAAKPVFDVRSLRAGQAYAVFSSKDSVPVMNYFVYEKDPRSYVVFNLMKDSVTMGYNPVEWKKKTAKGTVTSSLWTAMSSAGTDPLLAVELSNIFGWSIDFFGLQKEDEYRLIYQQEYVDGQPLSNFNILGAVLRHSDSSYYAIPFLQDNEILFYSEHGSSLKGAFLKAPLDFFRITSRFTNSRYHPVLKISRPHYGVDYAAPVGTPVYAIGSGTVIAKGYDKKGGGNFLKIKHNGTYVTSYMHLSRFEKGIQVGKSVKQKEVVAYVGSTGLSTGPHLDFRVFENNKPINPLTIKSQPDKPVQPANMDRFRVIRDSVMSQLQGL